MPFPLWNRDIAWETSCLDYWSPVSEHEEYENAFKAEYNFSRDTRCVMSLSVESIGRRQKHATGGNNH